MRDISSNSIIFLLRWIFGVVGILALGCQGWMDRTLWAQGENPLVVPKRPPAIFEQGNLKPDAYFFLDKSGNPILVPRASYEEFERFLRQQNKQVNPAFPGVHLDSIQGQAEVLENFVELHWTIRLSVSEVVDPVARIPLGMTNHILVQAPSLLEEQNGLIRRDNSGGFEWILRVESNRQYEVRFTTQVKKLETGNQRSIRLDLAEAPTKLQMVFADPQLEVLTSGTSTGLETIHDADKTQATLLWSGGSQVIQWQKPNQTSQSDAMELDSTTRWTITSDGATWAGNTRLSFRAFGKKSNRTVQVQLPNGVRWNRRQTASINDAVSIESSNLEGNPGIEVLQLRFVDFGEQMKEELSLELEWNLARVNPDQILFQGIEVQGVQRQEGRLDIDSLSGDRLSWTTSPDVVFLSQSRIPTENLGIRHSFRILNPGYQLKATLSKDENRILIRPTYLVKVTASTIQMRGFLEFGTTPPPLNDFRLHLGKFHLDRMEFNGRPIPAVDNPEGIVLSLWDAVGTGRPNGGAGEGNPTLMFTATMPWNEGSTNASFAIGDTKDVSLEIPSVSYPTGENRTYDRGSGELILAHDRNLRMLEESIDGLIPQNRTSTAISSIDLRKEFVEPGFEGSWKGYQFDNQGEIRKWSGRWMRLPRQISLRRSSDILADSTKLKIQQNFEMTIENDTLPRMQFLIPRSWLSGSNGTTNLRVLVRSQETSWTEVSESASLFPYPEGLSPSLWTRIELNGTNWFGKMDIEFQCSQSIPDLSSGEPVDLDIPLGVTPGLEGVRILTSIENLRVSSGLLCNIDSDWFLDSTSNNPLWKQLVIPNGKYSIPCKLQQIDSIAAAPIQIERAWLQSTLTENYRRDRFVIKFQSSVSSLDCLLPETRSDLPVRVWVDAKPVVALPHQDGRRITIPLEAVHGGSSILELWITSSPRSSSGLQEIHASMPTILSANSGVPFVWQVIVPPYQTLLWSSESLSPQYRWTTKSLGLRRESEYHQRELESWVGAASQPTIEQYHNDYVLSGLGLEQPLSLWVVPRVWIWFPLGSVVLILSASWYRFAWVRHPWMLVAASTSLVLLIPYAPDLAILLLQGVACATLLLLTMQISRWVVDRRVQRRSIFRSRPSSYVVRPENRPIDRPIATPGGSTIEPGMAAAAEGIE